MKWKKLTLTTTTQAVDLVSTMLSELGVDGIQIEDNVPLSEEDRQRMFIDILPELPPDDGTAKVSFYIEEDGNLSELLDKVREGLAELDEFVYTGEKTITVGETEDSDWVDNWKAFFKPFRIDDTIVIKPTWEEFPEKKENDIIIEIDPETAFGTGSHETTKLCILNLKQHMRPEDKVLDLGCGSGILSVAARKLGASYVFGTDIDENAVQTAKRNTEQNKLAGNPEDGCGFVCCNVLSCGEPERIVGSGYDIVVANILTDVIVLLSEIAGRFLKDGGLFISSGILETKADEVKEALLANGFDIVEKTVLGDWVSFVARRQG